MNKRFFLNKLTVFIYLWVSLSFLLTPILSYSALPRACGGRVKKRSQIFKSTSYKYLPLKSYYQGDSETCSYHATLSALSVLAKRPLGIFSLLGRTKMRGRAINPIEILAEFKSGRIRSLSAEVPITYSESISFNSLLAEGQDLSQEEWALRMLRPVYDENIDLSNVMRDLRLSPVPFAEVYIRYAPENVEIPPFDIEIKNQFSKTLDFVNAVTGHFFSKNSPLILEYCSSIEEGICKVAHATLLTGVFHADCDDGSREWGVNGVDSDGHEIDLSLSLQGVAEIVKNYGGSITSLVPCTKRGSESTCSPFIYNENDSNLNPLLVYAEWSVPGRIHDLINMRPTLKQKINSGSGRLFPPLHLSIYSGNITATIELANLAADLNLNYNGSIPLYAAIEKNNGSAIQVLFDYGARRRIREPKTRLKPIDYARYLERDDVVKLLEQY